jgi:transcriptional regulator with GAF, ATPase, and Fis domain
MTSKTQPASTLLTEDLKGTQPARELRAKLVILDGPSEGQEFLLDRRLAIGTQPDCDIALEDRAISRCHAEVILLDGGIVVRDLGSRNGTFLDGNRVVEAQASVGAVLKLGNTSLVFRFAWQIQELAPSSARRFGELYGESIHMRQTFAILEQVARGDATVLIEGETGTGKELAARSVHHASERAKRPFVVFDCTAVPRELIESELFGHVKGAFSGAIADRAGAFEQAHRGTIFLDELGELPLDLQPKLLRVLEAGAVRRVGSSKMVDLDVRVLAATNRDLHAEVRRGRFRSDLLYRLDVVTVRLPPLRQRPDDLKGLATRLLMGKLPAGDEVAGDNLAQLMGYSWPGNVRELRNVLERAVTMARKPDGSSASFSELTLGLAPSAEPCTLGLSYPGVASALPFKDAKQQLLSSFERAYLDALLARHGGNLTKAADAAQLSRKHLYEIIRRNRSDA